MLFLGHKKLAKNLLEERVDGEVDSTSGKQKHTR